MITLTWVCEDTVIVAERAEVGWTITLVDTFIKDRHEFLATDAQFGAIMALAIGMGEAEERKADESYATMIAQLYTVAGEVLGGVDPKISPIP